jgi:flagellar biosynthesis/type III secretory pathway protein FliH
MFIYDREEYLFNGGIMGFHDDMDRYLRQRKREYRSMDEPSWWSKMFAAKPKELPYDELTEEERAKLESMEHDIKQGEEQLKRASPDEQAHLEEAQEERVSFYQQIRKLFNREHKAEEAYDEFEHLPAPAVDTAVTDDFRELAKIQIAWLSRLPPRVMEEFKQSPDYAKYVEILQRRGVAKRK